MPFGLVGSRSCWGWCERAQPQLPVPSSWDAPDLGVPLHGIACARPPGSLRGWRVSRQLGVLWCCVPSHPDPVTLLPVPSAGDRRKRPVTRGVMVASPGGRKQVPGVAG